MKGKRDRARTIGNESKLLHVDCDGKSDGVRMVLESELSMKVFKTERWNGGILMACLVMSAKKLCVISV